MDSFSNTLIHFKLHYQPGGCCHSDPLRGAVDSSLVAGVSARKNSAGAFKIKYSILPFSKFCIFPCRLTATSGARRGQGNM